MMDVVRYRPKLKLPVWKHEGKHMYELECFPNDTYGFVYRLTLMADDGSRRYYIGKKKLFQEVQMTKLKSGAERKGHINFFFMRKNRHMVEMERLYKESNWLDYTGSADTDGYELIARNIAYLAKSPLELSYLECKAIFETDAIRSERYLNANILGKFYKRNLIE